MNHEFIETLRELCEETLLGGIPLEWGLERLLSLVRAMSERLEALRIHCSHCSKDTVNVDVDVGEEDIKQAAEVPTLETL